jgi:hypothetical protein
MATAFRKIKETKAEHNFELDREKVDFEAAPDPPEDCAIESDPLSYL